MLDQILCQNSNPRLTKTRVKRSIQAIVVLRVQLLFSFMFNTYKSIFDSQFSPDLKVYKWTLQPNSRSKLIFYEVVTNFTIQYAVLSFSDILIIFYYAKVYDSILINLKGLNKKFRSWCSTVCTLYWDSPLTIVFHFSDTNSNFCT